jgi:hypothetical protein
MHRISACMTPRYGKALVYIAFSTLPSFCKGECKTRAMSESRGEMQKRLILPCFLLRPTRDDRRGGAPIDARRT